MLGEGGGLVPAPYGSAGNWFLPHSEREDWRVPQWSYQTSQEQLGPHPGSCLRLPDRGPLYFGVASVDLI